MSYDLWFYRGSPPPGLTPEQLFSNATSDQPGLETIGIDELGAAFRAVFGDDLEIEERAVHGPLFSVVQNSPEGDSVVCANCAWSISERPDIYERIVLVATRELGGVCYDPQRSEFRSPPAVLPRAPELAPGDEVRALLNEFARIGLEGGSGDAAKDLKESVESLQHRFPEDPQLRQLRARIIKQYPD